MDGRGGGYCPNRAGRGLLLALSEDRALARTPPSGMWAAGNLEIGCIYSKRWNNLAIVEFEEMKGGVLTIARWLAAISHGRKRWLRNLH